MSNLLLTSIEYGGYISIGKLIVFLILFMPSLPLITWLHNDADAVGTRKNLWSAAVGGSAAATALIWMLVPIFIVGLAIYITAVAVTAIAYVKHRNTLVLEYDRILTIDHIKGLLSAGQAEKLDALKSFLFITANNNKVPMPEPKTPDFYGYRAAYNIFKDADQKRASNIILIPTHQNYNVAYIIDGVPIPQTSIEKEQMKNFIRFVKLLADLDIDEKRKPQKGNFFIQHEEKETQWEIITAGSTAGERMKLSRKMQENFSKLQDLDLMPEQLQQLNNLQNAKQGVFIISGPKKSGVTTTFYAILRNRDAFLNSIETLEMEVSADLPNINQKVFSLSDTGTTTFAKKLMGIIRMGPDIVGVAGCKDSEAAKAICQAAKNGKLMYVTLEAENIIQALDKWRKLVGDESLVIDTLLGITNQRLLRKLCNACKQEYTPNTEVLRKYNLPAKNLFRAGKVIYDKHNKPVTCEDCHGTGFIGRTIVSKIITLNDELRSQIKAKASAEINSLFRRAKIYLQKQALGKVLAGVTTINEMIRVFAAKKNKTKTARENPKQQ